MYKQRYFNIEDEEDLKYRTADMNNPDVLRSFLKILGIPSRPYNEIMQELAIYIQNNKVESNDREMIKILQDQVKNLNIQLEKLQVNHAKLIS